jgi:holo-[acyl-carrier protein] synthase
MFRGRNGAAYGIEWLHVFGESGYLLSPGQKTAIVGTEDNFGSVLPTERAPLIVGIGVDLQDISDFARSLARGGDPYVQRVFTASEIVYCRSLPDSTSSFAARFAAKEAAIKALRIAGKEGLSWHDFEITRDPSGAPSIRLSGVAANSASEENVDSLLLSLTHSRATAGAVVIAEANSTPKVQ